jgi:drug/metabolite transporter (DMT)-like permease
MVELLLGVGFAVLAVVGLTVQRLAVRPGTSTLLVVAGAAVFLQDEERVTVKLISAALVVVSGIVLVVQA